MKISLKKIIITISKNLSKGNTYFQKLIKRKTIGKEVLTRQYHLTEGSMRTSLKPITNVTTKPKVPPPAPKAV